MVGFAHHQQAFYVAGWLAALLFVAVVVHIFSVCIGIRKSWAMIWIHVLIFVCAAIGAHASYIEGDRIRTQKVAQEQAAKEEEQRKQKDQSEKDLAQRRAAAEQCNRERGETIKGAKRKRDATRDVHQKCLDEAPVPTFLNPRTKEDRCRDKQATTSSAGYELRMAEQKQCPTPPEQ
jgi:hypothetical protein